MRIEDGNKKQEGVEVGDIRYSLNYAYLPTILSDGRFIWFDYYLLEEEYEVRYLDTEDVDTTDTGIFWHFYKVTKRYWFWIKTGKFKIKL